MKADELQKALYGALSANAGLSALINGVYADVQQPNLPEDASAFPYVTIGQDNLSDDGTKTGEITDALCQIDIWSRSNNYVEAKEIGAAIFAALHKQSLSITGATHIATRVESEVYSADPDGHTKRGMIMARVTYSH